MKRNTINIAWVLYILGMILFAYEISFGPNDTPRWLFMTFAVTLILASQIICIVHTFKTRSVHLIWTFLLLSFGGIAIPIYLLTEAKRGHNQ